MDSCGWLWWPSRRVYHPYWRWSSRAVPSRRTSARPSRKWKRRVKAAVPGTHRLAATMASEADEKPLAPIIYVIKKNKGHGGHHGGAWKVAYADFVTAMMALFIVLWLLNTSSAVKKAVGGY